MRKRDSQQGRAGQQQTRDNAKIISSLHSIITPVKPPVLTSNHQSRSSLGKVLARQHFSLPFVPPAARRRRRDRQLHRRPNEIDIMPPKHGSLFKKNPIASWVNARILKDHAKRVAFAENEERRQALR